MNRVANNLGDRSPLTSSKVLPLPEQLRVNTTLPSKHLDRANATFVFLCRNNDINGVVSSIQQMEDRFNRKHGYPWVLLNEEPFTEEFKESVRSRFIPSIFSHVYISGESGFLRTLQYTSA